MLAPCRTALVMKYARRASLGYILARRLVIATRLPLSSATRSRMLLFLPIQMAWWGAPRPRAVVSRVTGAGRARVGTSYAAKSARIATKCDQLQLILSGLTCFWRVSIYSARRV